VEFNIDANSILTVSAKDEATGKTQNIRIEASSGLSKEDIEKMKREAEMNADADKRAIEEAQKVNAADAQIFQTEKQLKDYGDKISAEKRAPIEEAVKGLKEAHAARDIAKIDSGLAELSKTWEDASQELYAAMNAQQPQAGEEPKREDEKKDANVEDVQFEEVK
jgi:molecular chaperone DnaK